MQQDDIPLPFVQRPLQRLESAGFRPLAAQNPLEFLLGQVRLAPFPLQVVQRRVLGDLQKPGARIRPRAVRRDVLQRLEINVLRGVFRPVVRAVISVQKGEHPSGGFGVKAGKSPFISLLRPHQTFVQFFTIQTSLLTCDVLFPVY